MFAGENGRKTIILEYDTTFRNLLKLGKKMHSELFTTVVFIGDFSLRRSLRCGATTEGREQKYVYCSY